MSFFSEFFGIGQSSSEQVVSCPFPHHTANGIEYQESNPSAHCNTDKHVFHCKSCGTGLSETQFVERILGCSPTDAYRILKTFETAESAFTWDEVQSLSPESKTLAESFGISEQVMKDLRLATPRGKPESIQFPVFVYGQLMDIRTYTPGGRPKVKSRQEAIAGLIIPYDLWRESPKDRVTILCAGEKDMAVARSNNLNAITLTSGEMYAPRLLAEFKDRVVAICYDNDDTGLKGSQVVANAILPYAKSVKIVTGFHEVCKEPKEDITDFFTKYKKTRDDLIKYIQTAPVYTPDPAATTVQHPIVDLFTATKPENIGKIVRSNVQVVAVTDTTFTIPASIILEKTKASGDKDYMQVGECRTWEYNSDHVQDTLHMMDNNFKETTIDENVRGLLRVAKTERFVKKRTIGKITVFKAYVTDLFETNVDSVTPMEFQAYSFGHRLESGKKYLVTYKLIPHPYKGQVLTMLILDVVAANDSVSNFVLNDEHKRNLDSFRNLEGTVSERIEALTEKVKGLLGYNGNNTLIQAIDFSYHTALQFNFGSFHNVRGYLDTLIVGESRVGKSSTAEALRKTYGLGVFTSLAGNSATVPGLVGGSNKTASGFQTRAGVIPQNHRGLIIFEEFGKCKADLVGELTDIRSSGEVRITRVSGTISLPALVRMVALSNVRPSAGTIKPIATYPNGIAVITELVESAEDIARYDLLIVLGDRGNSQIDPFWQPQAPMPEAAYRTRVRWVWSRTPEQIIISEEVGRYIMQKANELNNEFDCHIKIFGTEAWKKLTRLSTAIAGYLVSTDDTYENIVVTKEHVDYAVSYFIRIYDNSVFKLRDYVQYERVFSTIDADGISALQGIYTKYPALIIQLSRSALCSKNMLSSASGLSADDLNKALSALTKTFFIKYEGYDIVPTERFRLGFAQVNRNTNPTRVGEQ